MNSFVCLLAMCCSLAVQAMPSGHGGHGDLKLVGVPDQSSYSKLVYPDFQLQELGTVSHGHLPAKEIKVIRTIKITVPHPFPVKVPHKVPYPVPVAKPYPVHVTKLVPHPVPVPVEVIKSIQVPVEVPKPYPVPQQEYNDHHGVSEGQQESQGWQPSGGHDSYQQGGQFESREGGFGSQEGHADQSAGYAAVIAAHQQNYGEQQQQQQEPQQQQYSNEEQQNQQQ